MNYLEGVWAYRYFWLSLVRSDLRTRYKRSFLGIGWSLLRPIALSIVICVVFSKLFNNNVREYLPFLLIGFTLWGFISEAIISGCNTFAAGEAYIRQHPVPLAIMPLRTILGTGFHALASFAVAIGATWILRGVADLTVLWTLLPTTMMVFFLGWSLAILAGLANVHFPDARHLLEVFLQTVFYLTPIIYPPEALRASRRGAWLMDLNPLTYFLELFRRPILDGTLPSLTSVAIAASCVLVVMVAAVLCLSWLERRLIFWL